MPYHYAECRYAEYRYGECRYAEYRYGECRSVYSDISTIAAVIFYSIVS
jgi:hypothetical protein